MREILFRGKKYKTSVFDETDWVYGSLIDSGNHEQVTIYPWYNGASTMSVRQLVYARMEAVKPETVGQYTGLTDQNGKKIFEGDIVDCGYGELTVVKWHEESASFYMQGLEGSNWTFDFLEVEIIGNIHDNPELLQVSE